MLFLVCFFFWQISGRCCAGVKLWQKTTVTAHSWSGSSPPNQIKDGGNLSERAFCLLRQDEYSCKVWMNADNSRTHNRKANTMLQAQGLPSDRKWLQHTSSSIPVTLCGFANNPYRLCWERSAFANWLHPPFLTVVSRLLHARSSWHDW